MTPTRLPPGDDFRVLPPEHMWKLARVIIQSWFAPMMRLRVYGQDRIPRGAAVIALEPHRRRRPDRARHGLPALDPLHGEDRAVARAGAAPRHPAHAARSRSTAATPTARRSPTPRAVLRSGNLLGIFVEGTRQTTDEIGAARTGVAHAARCWRTP